MQFNHKPAKMLLTKQGKSEGFDSCNQPRNLTQNWIQIFGFLAHVTWKFDGRTWETIGHLFYTKSSCVHHFKAISEFKLELQSGNAKFESKLVIFFPCDIKIWQTTLKNYRAPLLCYFKLCVSFHSHVSIQNGVTVWKRQICVKISDFFVPCDLEIWWMTLNKANLRDLIAATGLVILLKLDSNRRFFSLCDLEIWWMTQKNNRAPLLCYFKPCAAFRSHWWIQTGVTVRKRPI